MLRCFIHFVISSRACWPAVQIPQGKYREGKVHTAKHAARNDMKRKTNLKSKSSNRRAHSTEHAAISTGKPADLTAVEITALFWSLSWRRVTDFALQQMASTAGSGTWSSAVSALYRTKMALCIKIGHLHRALREPH